jgi:hypothetical protein
LTKDALKISARAAWIRFRKKNGMLSYKIWIGSFNLSPKKMKAAVRIHLAIPIITTSKNQLVKNEYLKK